MSDQLRFLINRIGERLWVKPLAMCVFSIGLAFVAQVVDRPEYARYVPEISSGTVEVLLRIMSASMLVIATFAVGSMVASYSAASATATPRAFSLIVADDVSQNALSGFIGAFIFSIVSLVALKTEVYGAAGRFALFCLTLLVFAAVILMFLRWVDSIARLGRLETTIHKVEKAASTALQRRRQCPRMNGVSIVTPESGRPVFSQSVGYVQRIEIDALQAVAERAGLRIAVTALPGTFTAPDRPLAYVRMKDGEACAEDIGEIGNAFRIGDSRTFEEDPRFGLVVLSEIAGRALSPAVNDPGTAISIIGALVRLFVQWNQATEEESSGGISFDRVEVPLLSVRDMFDDAFTPIARDGAGVVEVAMRLQKALHSLADIGDSSLRKAAVAHSQLALARAEHALVLRDDIAQVKASALLAGPF